VVFAMDRGKNIVSDSAEFLVDTKPPVLSLLSPGDDIIYPGEVLLIISANEITVNHYYSLNNGPLTAFINGRTSLNLTPGRYNLTVLAEDMAGNIGKTSTILNIQNYLSGYVKLQNAISHSTQITFELRKPGTTNIIANAYNDENPNLPGTQITTGSDGSYILDSIPEGIYDITAQGSKWLRQKRSKVIVSLGNNTGLDFNLLGGDATHSNSVNILDLNLLKATYGKSAGQPRYDERADFDNSNQVNIKDLNILKANYGKIGED